MRCFTTPRPLSRERLKLLHLTCNHPKVTRPHVGRITARHDPPGATGPTCSRPSTPAHRLAPADSRPPEPSTSAADLAKLSTIPVYAPTAPNRVNTPLANPPPQKAIQRDFRLSRRHTGRGPTGNLLDQTHQFNFGPFASLRPASRALILKDFGPFPSTSTHSRARPRRRLRPSCNRTCISDQRGAGEGAGTSGGGGQSD